MDNEVKPRCNLLSRPLQLQLRTGRLRFELATLVA
ncbi:hypothetical protein FLP15_06460 [Lactococcus protaetiae]|uniref:Uncharacterized protein n=1 Tax=Lactococcus protaetiae TaxID=2592653 RepID=A0A514Z8E3_9LACT|nr:hypothetical protein FLP15_06460 [Lactococcus protaetiae]